MGVEKVGKSGLMKGAMNGDMGEMNQKLQQTMDPKMLQKLGGAGNMMEMMKQMSSNEGAMGDMMRNMQQAQKQMKAAKKINVFSSHSRAVLDREKRGFDLMQPSNS